MSKDGIILSINPTFFLKKVDPFDLYQKYNSGCFSNLDISLFLDINVKIKNKKINVLSLGNDKESDLFSQIDNHNQIQIFATTNCNYYNAFNNLEVDYRKKEYKCDWCDRSFIHTPKGIPIEKEIFISNSENKEIKIYHTPTCHCTLSCAYATYIWETSNIRSPKFSLYNKSYSLLKELFNLESLFMKESPDPKLAKWNGGSLEEREFFQEKEKFVTIGDIVFSPAKIIYEKIKLI